MSRRLVSPLLYAVLAASSTGCGWLNVPTFHQPTLSHPGSADYQQRAAVRYDPYPSNELGPEIEGIRPYGYRVPPNEVTRAQQTPTWGNWRGHAR